MAAIGGNAAHHRVGEIAHRTSCRSRRSGRARCWARTKVPNGVVSSSRRPVPAAHRLPRPAGHGRRCSRRPRRCARRASHRLRQVRPASLASSRCGSVRSQKAAAPMPPSTSAAPISFAPRPQRGQPFLTRKASWQDAQIPPTTPICDLERIDVGRSGRYRGSRVCLELVETRPGSRPCLPRSSATPSIRRCCCPPGTERRVVDLLGVAR